MYGRCPNDATHDWRELLGHPRVFRCAQCGKEVDERDEATGSPAMTDDTITHEALAPCPFCGRTNSELLPEGPTSPSFVRCLCDCEIVGDDESDARTKWNTRAPLTAGSDFDQGYERGYNQGRSDAAADLARAPMTGPEVAAIRAEERKILLRRAASIIIAHEMRGEISDGAGSDLRSAIRALDKETDHE